MTEIAESVNSYAREANAIVLHTFVTQVISKNTSSNGQQLCAAQWAYMFAVSIMNIWLCVCVCV